MIRNYPAGYLTPFVGRTYELTDIADRLQRPECRLLTVTGLGGSGKTRLALEAAQQLASHFRDGVIFIGLQQISRTDLLIPAIARALGLMLYGDADFESQIFGFLHNQSVLLVLDNFEHLLSGADLLSRIIGHAPNAKILVTSQEALDLQEEWLYPLKGLDMPRSAYATSLEAYPSVQLFLYHARRFQPGFDLTTERDSIIRICEMTMGLPLAIELAASWLKGLTAAQIAAEMRRNLDFLSTTARNIEERHRSIRAVFDHSWTLMPEHERRTFAALSVFHGSFDQQAAGQVAGASLASLASLVEKSLVRLGSQERFHMHELLRQYGMEKLTASGERDTIEARHSSYFSRLVLEKETSLKQAQQLQTMQTIEEDFENIRAAWEWSVQHQQVENLQIMLNGLYLFGFLGKRNRDVLTLFQQTLEVPVSDTTFHARLLTRRWGFLHWWYHSDVQGALAGIEHALDIATADNNQFEVAFCHLMAAYVMFYTQRYVDAVSHLETSKGIFESIHEPYYVAWVLHRLGYAYAWLHDPDREIQYAEQSLSLARQAQDRFSLGICLYNLGSDYILKGDYTKAKQYGQEALTYSLEAGQQCLISHVKSLLALCAFCEGDYQTCFDYAHEALTIIQDIIHLVVQPYNIALLVLLACLREDYAEAVRLNHSGKHHSTNTMGFQLQYWALAALTSGLSEQDQARTYVENALQFSHTPMDAAPTIWIIPNVACLLAERDPEKAVELLSWVFAYPDTVLNWARQWPLVTRLLQRLQTQVRPDRYRVSWERGEELLLDDIKTYLQSEFSSIFKQENGNDLHLLTAREREILQLMAAGMTNPQIASQLIIGVGTVKTHTLNIYRKLEVANRTQAIVRAQELGLLPA
jgi:predicted ATPase/DNA-binding CsgD family transcriptional regulator